MVELGENKSKNDQKSQFRRFLLHQPIGSFGRIFGRTLISMYFYILVIIDANGKDCQVANFNIGTTTTVTRAGNIRVTQYQCSQEDVSGAPGCLQYYTQTSAKMQS